MSTHVTTEASPRIQRTLKALRENPDGLTSRQLSLKTRSVCPAADVSDLRKLDYVVHTAFEGYGKDGSRIYRYTLVGRAPSEF